MYHQTIQYKVNDHVPTTHRFMHTSGDECSQVHTQAPFGGVLILSGCYFIIIPDKYTF